jgi:hypothetical protein
MGSCRAWKPQLAHSVLARVIGQGAAAKLDQALTASEVPHDVKEYPQASHGFLNDHSDDDKVPALLAVMAKLGGMGYYEASARDARRRIASFFGEQATIPACGSLVRAEVLGGEARYFAVCGHHRDDLGIADDVGEPFERLVAGALVNLPK